MVEWQMSLIHGIYPQSFDNCILYLICIIYRLLTITFKYDNDIN